jgi:hypothetical protein
LQLSKEFAPMPFPRRTVISLSAWLLFTLVGTEFWYRVHETRETLRWSFEWPIAKEHFSDVVISRYAADELKFDEGRASSWTDSDGSRWTAFFFKWADGPTRSRILTVSHLMVMSLRSKWTIG